MTVDGKIDLFYVDKTCMGEVHPALFIVFCVIIVVWPENGQLVQLLSFGRARTSCDNDVHDSHGHVAIQLQLHRFHGQASWKPDERYEGV